MSDHPLAIGSSVATARVASAFFDVAYIDELPWATRAGDGSLGGLDGAILKACQVEIPLPPVRLHEIFLNGVEEALESQRFDLVTCGLGYSDRRAALARPSVPLFEARLGLFVRIGNPLGISSMADVLSGAFPVGTIGQGLEEYTIRPYTGGRTRIYSEQSAMWRDLAAGTIEAGYFERIAGLAFLARNPHAKFELAEPFDFPDAPSFKTALWFREGDLELAALFDDCLDGLKRTRKLGRLLTDIGASANDVVPIGSDFR